MSVTKNKRRDPHAGRSRGSKLKTGKRGAKSANLTAGEKVLLGKGVAASLKHVECKGAWSGVTTLKEPFDAVQSEKNKALGYW